MSSARGKAGKTQLLPNAALQLTHSSGLWLQRDREGAEVVNLMLIIQGQALSL